MKLMDSPELYNVIKSLTTKVGGNIYRLCPTIELYSCKMVQEDKRLFKSLASLNKNNDLQLSPPPTDKCFFHDLSISSKMLTHLIRTLNVSFGDGWDFSDCDSEDFSRITLKSAEGNIHEKLMMNGGVPELEEVKQEMWLTIDSTIDLEDCIVYTYNGDLKEVVEEPCAWCFNYYFYNSKLKRVLFYFCYASFALNKSVDEDNEKEDVSMDETF